VTSTFTGAKHWFAKVSPELDVKLFDSNASSTATIPDDEVKSADSVATAPAPAAAAVDLTAVIFLSNKILVASVIGVVRRSALAVGALPQPAAPVPSSMNSKAAPVASAQASVPVVVANIATEIQSAPLLIIVLSVCLYCVRK